MEPGGEQGHFAQHFQHQPCCRFGGAVAGKHGLFRGGAEPHRAQSRHTADEAIHQHGQAFQRAAQKNTAQPGDVEPAQLGEHVQRVSGIGPIPRNAPPDGIQLAGKPRVGKARAPACHPLHGLTQQNRSHGAGGGGVANAHLPRGQQLHPRRLLRPDKPDARRNGIHRLLAGHGRAGGEIRRPGGNAAVLHSGHRLPGHAKVHRHHFAAGRFCHLADTGAPGGKVLGHGPGHALVRLAHALRHHAVVGAEHQHGPAGKRQLCRAGQGGGILQHGLQPAQPAQRLGQAGPVSMGGGAGGLVRPGDPGKKLFQFKLCHWSCSS